MERNPQVRTTQSLATAGDTDADADDAVEIPQTSSVGRSPVADAVVVAGYGATPTTMK